MTFLRKVALTTVVFLAWAAIFPHQLVIASWQTAVLGALVLGVLNGLVRPVIKLLSLPITILTLGLFLLVINGAMLALMAGLVDGIWFSSFGVQIVMAIVISFVNATFGEPRD
ncbi:MULTISPECIES: phage holin family protein [Lacticaseibacillus]|uniref:Phage holin family protein n=2 Tax=Lacticaseibacillus TaxID=2759736 RepID=A0ABW4CG42_9LACO|nr:MULTISPECIES: phage holin family protein [Lacticaseibacillus]